MQRLRRLAAAVWLILVNGKRRHRSPVIAWLGNGIADGSQGPTSRSASRSARASSWRSARRTF